MDPSEASPSTGRSAFRHTLVRVIVVQAVTLALLWLLQATYGG